MGAGRASPSLWSSALANRATAGSVAHCNVLELYSEQLLGLGFDGAFTSVMDPIADTPATF